MQPRGSPPLRRQAWRGDLHRPPHAVWPAGHWRAVRPRSRRPCEGRRREREQPSEAVLRPGGVASARGEEMLGEPVRAAASALRPPAPRVPWGRRARLRAALALVSPTDLPASPSRASLVASLARLGPGRFCETAGRAGEEIPSGRLGHSAREGGGTLTASPRQRAASLVTPPKCKTSRPSWRPLNPLVARAAGPGPGSPFTTGGERRGKF